MGGRSGNGQTSGSTVKPVFSRLPATTSSALQIVGRVERAQRGKVFFGQFGQGSLLLAE